MTKISAKVIADSKNEFGNRITTMVVTFPRFILAELNTHRMMSRNSASSRAIPFEKMMHSIENNPFVPIAFQKDHSGMQGTEYLEGDELNAALNAYGVSINYALINARRFANTGATKQLVNRQLEPFMWHTVIVTATEWENFFALRCPHYEFEVNGVTHKYRSWKDMLLHCQRMANSTKFEPQIDTEIRGLVEPVDRLKYNKGQAEIHMMELAEQMWDAMNESTPKELKAGEWHIPFGDNIDGKIMEGMSIQHSTGLSENGETLLQQIEKATIKVATARCARVSYTVVGEEDKPANYENDIKLHDRLAESGHWSPFEHCAKVMDKDEFVHHVQGKVKVLDLNNEDLVTDETFGWSGNFKGFVQYRKTFNNENITK